jgi:hypothetical protein
LAFNGAEVVINVINHLSTIGEYQGATCTKEGVQDVPLGTDLFLEVRRPDNALEGDLGCSGNLVCHGIPSIQCSYVSIYHRHA